MSIHLHTPPPARRRAPAGRNRPLAEAQEEQTRKQRKRRPGIKLGGEGKSFRFQLKGIILYPLLTIGLGLLLVSANRYVETLPLRDIEVELHVGPDNAFLTIADVREILTEGESHQPLIGRPMNELNLANLEQRLSDNPFVAQAEVSKSLMGALRVELSLREAVGRLINNSGSHLYLDSLGHKFPTSPHHTAYVPLVRGDFEEAVADTFGCSSVAEALPLLNFLRKHPFWRAQIAEVVIFQDGQIELQPQVGDMPIEFGYPDRIEEKFQNLMDFYKQVIPEVGWRKYRGVSVKYRGQVVARK